MHTSRPGSCFIVPPFVLENLAREGTPEQREWALETLSVDHGVRASRIQRSVARQISAHLHQEIHTSTPHLRRTIFDAHQDEDAGATDVVRAEGDPASEDAAVNEAYEGFGATHNLYWEVFLRDSIDDHGLALEGVVHYGENFDNAFWNGSRMIFGDGDGQIMTRTTAAIDVIGHELTHGVVEYEANLAYIGQSGALNESIADVFGSLVKQYRRRQTAEQADWLVGEGIVGPALGGGALRSMSAPGTAYEGDPQPAHLNAYVHTTRDNGGVHINSGIPNRAFHLASMSLGGFAWEKAGRIWYEALRSARLRPAAHFHHFAQATIGAARHLFGGGCPEVGSIMEAWREVGVTV